MMTKEELEQHIMAVDLSRISVLFVDVECVKIDDLMNISIPNLDHRIEIVAVDCRQYESVKDAVLAMSADELKERLNPK